MNFVKFAKETKQKLKKKRTIYKGRLQNVSKEKFNKWDFL